MEKSPGVLAGLGRVCLGVCACLQLRVLLPGEKRMQRRAGWHQGVQRDVPGTSTASEITVPSLNSGVARSSSAKSPGLPEPPIPSAGNGSGEESSPLEA